MVKYSAIKDMYYGNRGQHDSLRIKDDDVKILDSIIDCDDFLRNKLNNDKDLLEKYQQLNDALCELNCIENEHCYIEGFKFGFLMAMDVFDNIE